MVIETVLLKDFQLKQLVLCNSCSLILDDQNPRKIENTKEVHGFSQRYFWDFPYVPCIAPLFSCNSLLSDIHIPFLLIILMILVLHMFRFGPWVILQVIIILIRNYIVET